MCLPYIKVVIVSIMYKLVLKREFYFFFLSVLLDNSKSIKRKEVSKAADKGAPFERRASTVSTPPHPQDDFQDNTCWKYALEAIIKWLLLYFLVHDNCLLFML